MVELRERGLRLFEELKEAGRLLVAAGQRVYLDPGDDQRVQKFRAVLRQDPDCMERVLVFMAQLSLPDPYPFVYVRGGTRRGDACASCGVALPDAGNRLPRCEPCAVAADGALVLLAVAAKIKEKQRDGGHPGSQGAGTQAVR